MNMKYITAVYSALVWGSGQFLNRQKLKGLILFLLQSLLVGIEVGSSKVWETAALRALETTGQTGLGAILGNIGAAAADIHNYGFFVKGIWGLVTLGTIPRVHAAAVYDHSIILLLGGIIAALFLLLFVTIWIWNIRDAYKTRVLLDAGIGVSSVQYFRDVWKNSFEYIMITPGLILVVFISLVPIVFAVLVAFTNFNMNFIPPRKLVQWTGLETFTRIVGVKIWGTTLLHIFIWTVAWAFLATFTSYAAGFFQALVLRSKAVRFRSLWRGILILPWAVPALVSMLIFKVLLNQEGVINQLLLGAGLVNEAIPFLSDPFWARFCLVAVNVWLGFPYFMVLISGLMMTIPQEQYEACELDGAGAFQQFRSITLPFILSATAPQLLMSLTFNFNNFNMIYFLTKGGPPNPAFQMAGSTDILISWIFKLTLDQRMYNYASALSIIIFVVIASVSAWNLLRTRAFKED